MQKLKTKIEKQYKEILKIPKNKIDFYYFVAIHDYIKLIDENDDLRNRLNENDVFRNSNPYNLIIERGRAVAEINKVFKAKKVPILLVAFFNLYAIYVAIEDLDNDVEKTSLTENRCKMAKHMKKIRDRDNIVGIGYAWFFKNKYHEWLRLLHKEILLILDNHEPEKVQENEVALKDDKTYSYKYDKINNLGTLLFGNNKKRITFEKDRAMIVYYFYELRNLDKEHKTYRDFNTKMMKNITSPVFRQSIIKINERARKQNKFVKEIISLKKKNKINEANRYLWKIKI